MSNDVAVYEHSEYDGYDDAEVSDRVIQGSILKQIDGRTSVDGVPFPDTPLIAVDIKKIAQRWGNQIPLETIVHHPGEPLPDIDKLNARIPQSQWEPCLDGHAIASLDLGNNYTVRRVGDGVWVLTPRQAPHGQAQRFGTFARTFASLIWRRTPLLGNV